MAYAAPTDLTGLIDENLLIVLTDDRKVHEIDEAIIAAAIAKAEPLVDAALGSAGITTPITMPNPYITSVTTQLSIKFLFARKAIVDAPATLVAMWEWAERELSLIADGKRTVTTGGTSTSTGKTVVLSDPDRDWGAAELF